MTDQKAPAEQPQTLLAELKTSHSSRDLAFFLNRARLLFACYRKDDAVDPTTYVQAVVAILAEFSHAVVEYVTDPRTGIQSEIKWVPSIAELKEACVKADKRMRDLARPTSRPRASRPYVPPNRFPGYRANVIIRPEVTPAIYEAARAWVDSGQAHEYDWKIDAKGLWISLAAYELLRGGVLLAKNWKVPSDADLRARYGRAAQDEAAAKEASNA